MNHQGSIAVATINWLIRYAWQHRRAYAIGLLSLFFVDALNVALPLVIKAGIDAIDPKDTRMIWWAGLGYVTLMIVQSGGRYVWRICLFGASHRIANRLRISVFDHMTHLPAPTLSRLRSGDIMSRATNDIEAVRVALGPGVLVAADAVMLLCLMIPAMAWLSWKLTLVSLAFLPIVPWLTAKLGAKIESIFEDAQAKMSRFSAFAQESFGGVRLIKSLAIERTVEKRFEHMSAAYREQASRLAANQAILSPLLSLLTSIGTFAILLVGGLDVLSGAMTVGTFIAFQRYIVQLAWPMEAVGWAISMMREGRAANRRVEEILSSTTAVSVRTSPVEPLSTVWANRLEIRGLSHHLSDGSRRFSLEIEKVSLGLGRRVGIVGPIGSGKTTLFHLILRMEEPPVGTIVLDGRDITSVPFDSLRKQIASVEQNVVLFSETIRDNLTLGLDHPITDAELWEVLRVAALDDEARRWTDGLESRLGERGVTLSGGQKQRLALARALLRRPSLLLLDDSFSAVDVDVEDQIISNLLATRTELTLCFSTHRLAILPKLDEVWVLDAGKLVATGTHQILLTTSPLYQNLWAKGVRTTASKELEVVQGAFA